MQIKAEQPHVKAMFIGLCISKKAEAESISRDVACALTFEEQNITPSRCPTRKSETESPAFSPSPHRRV